MPKVHYAIWSETCSKPAGDLLTSKSQTCVHSWWCCDSVASSKVHHARKSEDLFSVHVHEPHWPDL